MGIRTTQVFGLNDWAREFVDGAARAYKDVVTRTWDDGRTETFVTEGEEVVSKQAGEFQGMFGESYPLTAYLVDGRWYEEYVQAKPWSSGPCVFLALRDDAGGSVSESLWEEEAVESA